MKLFCIFITLLLCLYAEEVDNLDVGVEGNLPATFSEANINNVNHKMGFKWAWEMPRYADTYERLRGKPWLEAANMWEISGSFSHRRENDDQDNYTAIGYASFRPFIYDFGTGSLAFGISKIIRYTKISDFDPKVVNANLNGLNVIATVNQNKTEAFQNAINFSTLLSLPEHGFQMILDVGYGFSNLRQTIDPIEANVGGVNLALDEYQYHQKDRGFFAGVNFLKSFDRPYFDYIRLFVYGAYREVTTKRKSSAQIFVGGIPITGKQFDLEQVSPIGLVLDPQGIDETNLSFVAYQLYVRLFTIPTPISEDRGISISFYNKMVYTSFELLGENFHGFQFQWGTQIGLFDGVNLRIAFVDEEDGQNNDRVDGWEISVSVQLSGLIRAILEQ